MKKVITLMVLVFLLSPSGPANAGLMAIWDFGSDAGNYKESVTWKNANVIGTPTLSVSGGDYDPNGKDGVAYTDAAGTLHDLGQAAAWDNVKTESEWIMTINTMGWEDMTIRWDYCSDATDGKLGPNSFDLDYKVGDGDDIWMPILNNYPITRDDAWHDEFSWDLSGITAIEKQTIVQFRVDDLDRLSPDGDYWQDNIQLTGVPEPATLVLLGIGGLVILARKRRSV